MIIVAWGLWVPIGTSRASITATRLLPEGTGGPQKKGRKWGTITTKLMEGDNEDRVIGSKNAFPTGNSKALPGGYGSSLTVDRDRNREVENAPKQIYGLWD